MKGPFNGLPKGHSKNQWSVSILSAPIKMKIKIIERKFENIVKWSTSLSFIKKIEIAAANKGNLIQVIPFNSDSIVFSEKDEEKIDIKKNIIPYFNQFIFTHDQDLSVIELIINVLAIKVINISTIDLLIIIRNGMKTQDKIKNFWKLDLLPMVILKFSKKGFIWDITL